MDFSHLHDKFFESYKKRYHSMIKLWQETRASQSETSLESFKFQVHSLKGESGTLGFNELFEIATQVDNDARAIVNSGFTRELVSSIDQSLNKLIAAHKQNPNPLLIHPDSKPAPVETESDKEEHILENLSDIKIALVDDDRSVALALKELLSSFGFEAEYFDSIEACKAAIRSQHFDLVLLDVVMPNTSEAQVFEFASECLMKGLKVIPMSSRDDLNTRLTAVRTGVHDYALKPVNINTLISKIRRTFRMDIERPFKIVLLDDQPNIGEYFTQVAIQQGFELNAFSDAKEFVENLNVSIPDIFLLDINMPDISGLEVAKILRHEARFEYVPIVFLSADHSLETKLKVLEAGGEDVISKSDSPEHIFAQIECRMMRGQHVRSMAVKDGLTGLLNHAQLMEALSNCQRMASRLESTFAVAMIDLDNFKHINDTYGHSIGDNVLVGLSQLMRRRIRQSDITGRYGGEEFMLVFQDVKDEQAIIDKLNSLREAFHSIRFEAGDSTIQATFSCGVSFSVPNASIGSLVKQADKAMYDAKTAGKNQVCRHN